LATEVDLGSADHLAVGQIERVDIGERTFVLCRVTEDHFRVVDGLCTHGAAPLAEGYLNGCEIECPKHNGRFDVNTGAPTRRPVKLPINTYDVRVENNRLLAQL
jgi:3-phenylpropionate/trans-cinnamate dioxygenase ferredoxin subunit